MGRMEGRRAGGRNKRKGRVGERREKERGGRREVKKGGGVRCSLLCFLNVRE